MGWRLVTTGNRPGESVRWRGLRRRALGSGRPAAPTLASGAPRRRPRCARPPGRARRGRGPRRPPGRRRRASPRSIRRQPRVRGRAVVALEEVLHADLPVRSVLRLRALQEAEAVDVDPRLGDTLGNVLEEIGERLGALVGAHEEERPPGLEPERDEAELLAVDAALALGSRRREQLSVEAVRPRVVRALEGRAPAGAAADDGAPVPADVEERAELSLIIADDDDGDVADPGSGERARLRYVAGVADVLPRRAEDALALELEDGGIRVPGPGQRARAVQCRHGSTLAVAWGAIGAESAHSQTLSAGIGRVASARHWGTARPLGHARARPSGGRELRFGLEAREVDRSPGAQIADDGVLVARPGHERLPAGEVLAAMEVARRDRGEATLRDPAEEHIPVEELEPVGELTKPRVPRETPREPPVARARERLLERVRRDERGAGLCGRSHRLRDPVVDGDVVSEPNREG